MLLPSFKVVYDILKFFLFFFTLSVKEQYFYSIFLIIVCFYVIVLPYQEAFKALSLVIILLGAKTLPFQSTCMCLASTDLFEVSNIIHFILLGILEYSCLCYSSLYARSVPVFVQRYVSDYYNFFKRSRAVN